MVIKNSISYLTRTRVVGLKISSQLHWGWSLSFHVAFFWIFIDGHSHSCCAMLIPWNLYTPKPHCSLPHGFLFKQVAHCGQCPTWATAAFCIHEQHQRPMGSSEWESAGLQSWGSICLCTVSCPSFVLEERSYGTYSHPMHLGRELYFHSSIDCVVWKTGQPSSSSSSGSSLLLSLSWWWQASHSEEDRRNYSDMTFRPESRLTIQQCDSQSMGLIN